MSWLRMKKIPVCYDAGIFRLRKTLSMKPALIIALVLLSMASIATASLLFLNEKPKSSISKNNPPATIDIKWGEGSEAGTPDNTLSK